MTDRRTMDNVIVMRSFASLAPQKSCFTLENTTTFNKPGQGTNLLPLVEVQISEGTISLQTRCVYGTQIPQLQQSPIKAKISKSYILTTPQPQLKLKFG